MTKHTLRELIHAINIIGDDKDVYVDGNGSIAVCPPVTLTKAGLERYGDILDAPICEGTDIGADATDEQCDKAWELLSGAAGYMSVLKYQKYFEGSDDTEEV